MKWMPGSWYTVGDLGQLPTVPNSGGHLFFFLSVLHLYFYKKRERKSQISHKATIRLNVPCWCLRWLTSATWVLALLSTTCTVLLSLLLQYSHTVRQRKLRQRGKEIGKYWDLAYPHTYWHTAWAIVFDWRHVIWPLTPGSGDLEWNGPHRSLQLSACTDPALLYNADMTKD